MDKKIYIKPVCEVAEFEIQDSLLLNCSIGVDNTPQDGIRSDQYESRFYRYMG